jgi:hypothetical protein
MGWVRNFPLPAMRALSDDGVLAFDNKVLYSSSWNSQKLAVEQLMPKFKVPIAHYPFPL